VNATEVYWNDTDSWRTEYSNNPMCCVRDIVLNKRYGLGEYLEEDDLHTTTVTNVIQECSATYTPYEKDYLDWWNNGDASEFGEKIQFTTVSGSGIVNTASRLVQGSSAQIYQLIVDLNSPLITNQDYDLNFTINNSSSNVNVSLYLYDDSNAAYLINIKSGNLTNIGDGTHSVTFTPSLFGKSKIKILIEGVSGNVDLKVTDVSITKSSGLMHWHEWDGVLDRKQAALSLLLEMCDSFRTWPVWYGGKFGFIYDSDDTPIHTLTVSNMNDFNQQFMSLSEIPYRLIGQFSDADNKWELRSLMAKASPNLGLSKINEKTIGLKGITNRKRASRELKWKLDNVINRNLTVNFKTGLDAIHANAGDIVYVQDDLPSWGQGGRITNYNATDKKFTLTEEITVASVSADNIIRYQLPDNSFATASVDASNLSNGDSTRIISLKNVTATPVDDAYFAFGEIGSEAKKFRIISTSRNSEDSVEVTALEHISSLYSSSHASIIVEDIKMSKPVNEMQKPHAPVDVSVLSIEPSEGLGFWLTANPDSQDTMANEVVVQMRRVGSDDDFNTIAIIPRGQNKTKYVDNNLKPNSTYEFKFFSRTKYKTGIPTILTHTLAATGYQPDPPSGLRIKGADPNTSTFSGKDVTIEWNPVGIGGQTDLVDGYVVKVYHTSFSESNKLRESFVKNEYFKYTYEMMIEDSGGTIYGTESDNLIFTVQTKATNGVLSIASDPLFVYNTIPANISSLSSESTVGGVKFYWRKSNEDDHKAYQYKLKVGSGNWSAVSNTEDNSLIRTLNATEIDSYGNRAGIAFKVKDLDWFGQSSDNWASTCASANTISCDIFRLSISLSASISGTSASLIDGETNSGGVLIP